MNDHTEMHFDAPWITHPASGDGRTYNTYTLYRRDFKLGAVPRAGRIAVTADSWYRLKVNGQWINDGPARAWTNHYSFDTIDLEGVLRAGINRIEAEVRYFGCGTFHQTPLRDGFAARLEYETVDGETGVIVTDSEWLAAKLPQWVENVMEISVQQPPSECFDASEMRPPEFFPASIINDPQWKNLREREIPQLSRREALLRRIVSVRRVRPEGFSCEFSPGHLHEPGNTTVNSANNFPLIAAMEINCDQTLTIKIKTVGMQLAVNGKAADANGEWEFRRGCNLLTAANILNGHSVYCAFAFPSGCGITAASVGECRLWLPTEFKRLAPDIPFMWADKVGNDLRNKCIAYRDAALALTTMEKFIARFPSARPARPEDFLISNGFLAFNDRTSSPALPGDVTHPEYLIYPDDRAAEITPVPGCDIEICCDLGEQDVGYWNFCCTAPAGTIIDIFGIEYISPTGEIQHTGSCANCLRYICREGFNRFTSTQRRSGRYIFITLRRLTAPVKFHSFRLVESTYPVVPEGDFHCSEPRLDQVYDASRRTLKLCMEDTFTDCPLYEQTLWVGDARSESLFAMSCFGAYDLVRRCIRLAAESLDTLPLVGCQLPSGWDCLIPCWSFMWEISVLDYYEETGDEKFLREMWPAMRLNLDNAEKMIDPETGLFHGLNWNLFDWSRTDIKHPTMLYESFFMIGAIDAALKCAEVLGVESEIETYRARRTALQQALNRYWDGKHLAYPDSIHADGSISEDFSVHTSILAVLFNAAEEGNLAAARANALTNRSDLIPIGSPFAAFYHYQTLERLGHVEELLERIRHDYYPMLATGATTVWETFPHSPYHPAGFPTRSHCHAWSATPLYFLPRLILGIRPETGGRDFVISPVPCGLEFASGSRATINGRIEVEWRRNDRNLKILVRAPEGVGVRFEANPEIEDMDIDFDVRSR